MLTVASTEDSRGHLPRTRRAVFSLIAILGGFAAAVAGAEIALRLHYGALLEFEDLRPVPWGIPAGGFAQYDPLLGWVPSPNGKHTWRGGWSASCDRDQLRRNGTLGEHQLLLDPPLLAVGDSSAFGDEVEDDETWPAHLEQQLQRRVLNAGVGGYGIDQAVLRAERLLPRFHVPIIVISIVSDDVTRTAFSFRNRWKPYFSLEGGTLSLTPPPDPQVPLPESRWIVAAGHSHLARFVLRRFPETWNRSTHRRVHQDERQVSGRLLARLNEFAEENGAKLLVVFIVGGDGDVQHFPDLLDRARASGVTTLDLTDELLEWTRDPAARERMFQPHYHLSSEGNAWAAERIAGRLRELGWLQRSLPRGGQG